MSTVFASASVSGARPSVVGGTLTTPKIFPSLLLPGFALTATAPASVVIPGAGLYEGQAIDVVAAGNITLGSTSSPTINFLLQNGTSLSNGSNTTICTLASALTGLTVSATYPFCFKATLQGDSTSGKVQVVSSTLFINSATAGTITNTQLTGQSFYNTPALNLVCGITFGVSDASNSASLMQFEAAD